MRSQRVRGILKDQTFYTRQKGGVMHGKDEQIRQLRKQLADERERYRILRQKYDLLARKMRQLELFPCQYAGERDVNPEKVYQ